MSLIWFWKAVWRSQEQRFFIWLLHWSTVVTQLLLVVSRGPYSSSNRMIFTSVMWRPLSAVDSISVLRIAQSIRAKTIKHSGRCVCVCVKRVNNKTPLHGCHDLSWLLIACFLWPSCPDGQACNYIHSHSYTQKHTHTYTNVKSNHYS